MRRVAIPSTHLLEAQRRRLKSTDESKSDQTCSSGRAGVWPVDGKSVIRKRRRSSHGRDALVAKGWTAYCPKI
jgi:hypothetical protein